MGKLLWVSGEPAPAGLSAQYQLVLAADATQALEKLAEHPEVMLADMELLGPSAMELIARAKSLEPSLMVLLLTSQPDGDLARRAEAAQSVVRVLAKPAEPKRLEHWVDNSLKLSRLRRANLQLTQLRQDLGRAKPPSTVLRVVVLEPSELTQLSVAPGGPAGPRQVELSWTADPNTFLAMVALAADLAIVDLELAGGTPTEWVLRARMAPGRSRLPLILLGRSEAALAEPRTVTLKKPITFEQVLKRIGALASEVEAGR